MAITPVVITLSEPVIAGKETYKDLTFARELKTKDLVAMDAVQGQMRKTLAMYASMSGVPFGALMELSTDDFEAVALAVAPLMGKRGKAQMAAMAEAAPATETETDASAT